MSGITVIASATAQHQIDCGQALTDGLKKHGLKVTQTHTARNIKTERVAVWGWRAGQKLHAQGHDVLVMERAYIGDRLGRWFSLAWNGLNGYGSVAHAPNDPERFDKYHSGLYLPDDPSGDYVLICGQVHGDAALKGRDIRPWYEKMARKYAGEKVFFRPHPRSGQQGLALKVKGAPTLDCADGDEALKNAKLVVTYNSNMGVLAKLAGKEVTADDAGSMIWNAPERRQWANRLAYRQWLLEEIASGEALEYAGLRG